MNKPRILIVEDDNDWQQIYIDSLSVAAYEIKSTRKIGSGSKHMIMRDGQIVFNHKPTCHQMVHIHSFRKGQGLTNIPG